MQVLANLVRNAFDAQAEAGEAEPVRLLTRIDTERAAFEIFDSGPGIPAHAKSRVGEPFFTTKAPGRGLGLGVFLARAFAEKMGGELTLVARPGGGTVARLIVPRDMAQTLEPSVTTEPERAARSVLVVDDDDVFRTRLGKAFQDRGFDVRTAHSAAEAIRLAQQESPEFAVVDLRMPGASGLDVVRELHAIDPATVMVMLTGYGSIATAVEAVRAGALHYLSKPVDIEQILAAFEGKTATSAAGSSEVPSLARVEWEHIQRVLSDCDGNISQAARLLGLHRRSLQRKLSKDPVRR